MHELAITQSMLDIVLERAKESGAQKVGAINLVVGELSGYVPESVSFYFDFLSKDTIAEGAALNFKSVSPRARCRSCDKPFEIKEFDWSCPRCGGSDIEITAGKELTIDSIDIE